MLPEVKVEEIFPLDVQKVTGNLTENVVRVEAWRQAAKSWEWAWEKDRDCQHSVVCWRNLGAPQGYIKSVCVCARAHVHVCVMLC